MRHISLISVILCVVFVVYEPGELNANCTTSVKSVRWARNTIVYYLYDSSVPPGLVLETERAIGVAQLEADRLGLGIRFVREQIPANPTKLKFQVSLSQPPNCKAAETIMPTRDFATITFFLYNYCNPATQLPLYNGTANFEFKVALHEIAHTLGFADQLPAGGCSAQTPGYSVMNIPCAEGDATGRMAMSFSVCDVNTLETVLYPPHTGPTCDGGNRTGFSDNLRPIVDQCDPACGTCPSSPVVVDLDGDGYVFTDAPRGVYFDIVPGGFLEKVAWTAPGSNDAWLVLDRNLNGLIDDGKELFGNFTSQPVSASPNGFAALAEFDRPELGGNADGIMSSSDAIWTSLRLWVDADQDGVATSDELLTPESVGILGFELEWKSSRKSDEYGNVLRYRAKIMRSNQSRVGRYAYDVFLVFD